MFKNLIKKVREESHNASILPETGSDEINENSTKDQTDNNEYDHEISRSTSISSRKSRTHSDENVKIFSDIFTGSTDFSTTTITSENWLDVLKLWILSKEEILREKDHLVEHFQKQTEELHHEIHQLRTKFTEFKNSTENIPHSASFLQRKVDILDSENESLRLTIKDLRSKLIEVESERDDLLIKSTEVISSKASDDENENQRQEIERLRELIIERDKIIEEQDKRLLIDRETQGTQTVSLDEYSVVEIFAEPNNDPIRKFQTELDDKNRTIKILQQRYNDLRKTLQREFNASIPKNLNQTTSTNGQSTTENCPSIHFESIQNASSDFDPMSKRSTTNRNLTTPRKNVAFSTTNNEIGATAAILPHTIVETSISKPQKIGQRNSIEGQQFLNATNFKYLKHVLLKFITSTEEEAVHLIRAVSTLLNFSSDEERLVRETLDYKMSWFGKVARLKSVSSNGNY